MDTPDKSTVQPSPSSFLSKFEDSPVFNYISTLSPIKPFSVGDCIQPFHLTFASPQALQTPPTSYSREPKFTRASHVTEIPKNNCFHNGSEDKNVETTAAIEPAVLQNEKVDKINIKMTVSSIDDTSKMVSEIPRSLKYECDSPENNVVHCESVKTHHEFNVAGKELFPVKVSQGNSKEEDGSSGNEMGVPIQMAQNKEICEWENFVCEASDILNCHSPTKEIYDDELDDRNTDSGMLSFVATVLQPPNEHMSDPQKMDLASPIISEIHHMENSLNHSGEIENLNERNLVPVGDTPTVLAKEVVHHLKTEIDDKPQQTTRRRCLVYEMSGSRYRELLADSTGRSPTKPAASSSIANDDFLMTSRPGGSKFTSVLPGIGLHLNALAATAKDKIIVKRQTLTCKRKLITLPCTTSFGSLISETKPFTKQMAPVVKREVDEQKDEAQVSQVSGDVSENSIFGEGVEVPQNSPKKKRQKADEGETDSCKRCNCKRSKCLKLYCECFAAGLYCVEPCNCLDCFNKPVHEETVLETRRQIESRNPLAFAPKVVRCSSTPNSGEEMNKTPASARHKRGCNCKKSGCLKKYCECFQGGVGCSLSCRCEGCKNTFGLKEGTESFVFQQINFLQRNASDVSSQDDALRPDENHDQTTPEPSLSARQWVRRPFHLGDMGPHFPALPSGSSLQSCSSQNIEYSDQRAIDVHEEDLRIAVSEVDAHEALKGDYLLPTTCVKSSSPNCKRISSPHCEFKTSPGWRSCRKLILQSIPSLPTFTLEKESKQLQGKLQ